MPAQLDQLWEDIRTELRRETPDFKYHIWLEPLELAAVRGQTLYIRAPDHIRTSVAERYLPLLRRMARTCFDDGALVEVVDRSWQPPREESGDFPGSPRHPLTEFNPKYTFEQFVIGESNHLAHAAALAVAELPAQAYNPLFLHGPPGIGKTHLLHAIGDYLQRYAVDLRVRYATIDEFTTDFVEALRERRTADFKERFRSADVVLIDDVQFLAGRAKTREEFFHTFNVLLDSGRQLVMTSDRGPKELADLEARLVERFRSGLVVELEAPGYETRRAILAARTRLDAIDVSGDVLDEIARRVTTSVRALEGALIRAVAYASLRGVPPTLELARHILRRLDNQERPGGVSIPAIVDAAAGEFGVEREALMGRGRHPQVARARQVAMYMARELTAHSLPDVGRSIGGRSHTTVLHAVNRVHAVLDTDPDFRAAVDNLRRRLCPHADTRAE